MLLFTAAGETADNRERVCVRLTPRALHEFYVETKDLSGPCAAIKSILTGRCPAAKGTPTHRRCSAEAYSAPDRFLKES